MQALVLRGLLLWCHRHQKTFMSVFQAPYTLFLHIFALVHVTKHSVCSLESVYQAPNQSILVGPHVNNPTLSFSSWAWLGLMVAGLCHEAVAHKLPCRPGWRKEHQCERSLAESKRKNNNWNGLCGHEHWVTERLKLRCREAEFTLPHKVSGLTLVVSVKTSDMWICVVSLPA